MIFSSTLLHSSGVLSLQKEWICVSDAHWVSVYNFLASSHLQRCFPLSPPENRPNAASLTRRHFDFAAIICWLIETLLAYPEAVPYFEITCDWRRAAIAPSDRLSSGLGLRLDQLSWNDNV